ncbi:MAG: class I SAM-dependent RNA methyltransferase, partial [Mangrovicoccus sp.]|nr:class I SAM-dependent RNA methyltransferase [Mangrovicoccus sp.]
CTVLRPALRALLPALEAITRIGATRKAGIDLAVTETETGADVAVSGGKPLDLALHEALTEIGQAHGLARLSWNGELVAEWAVPRLRLGAAMVPVPPGAFLQATAEGQAALTAGVREALDGAGRIADLFAGCGTFALPLAEQAELVAVEGEATLLAALEQGWRGAQGLKAVRVETRDLFRRPLMPDELARFEGVVIDPPRARAQAQTAELARSDMPRIAAVSCNPVSFARDAAALVAGGYRLEWVQMVDQFRWSPHLELVAAFARG